MGLDPVSWTIIAATAITAAGTSAVVANQSKQAAKKATSATGALQVPAMPALLSTTPEQAQTTAAEAQRKRLLAGTSGRLPTLLTSPLGVPEAANVQRRTLLGVSGT